MKISVITVCFNSDKYIKSAIDSVLSQSYTNYEYIVVDGGSTDNTIQIVKSFNDKRIILISEPDDGIYDAMNKGITKATGDIICILNSDDFYSNGDVFSYIISNFKSDISIILGNVDFVSSSNIENITRVYSCKYIFPFMLRFGLMPPHPSSFVRSDVYKLVGLYKIDYKIAADFEWFIRALYLHKLNFIKVDYILVRMREGGISTSGLKSNFISSKEMVRALISNKIYTNTCLVSFRFLFKIFSLMLFRVSNFFVCKRP